MDIGTPFNPESQPGLDNQPLPPYSKKYGNDSPIGRVGSDGVTRLEQMPQIQEGDAELIDAFYAGLEQGLDLSEFSEAQIERLLFLDKYLDLPSVEAAINYSHKAIFRCVESDCIVPDSRFNSDIGEITREALDQCNFAVIKWLHYKHYDIGRHQYHFDNIVKNNRLDILQWLHGKDYDIGGVLNFAGEFGNPEMLEWLLSVGYAANIHTVKGARLTNNISVLGWMSDKDLIDAEYLDELVQSAVHDDQTEILDLLHSKGAEIRENMFALAVPDKFKSIEWLLNKGLFPSEATIESMFKSAAGCDAIRTIKWLISIGGQFKLEHLYDAIWSGCINVLKFAHHRGMILTELSPNLRITAYNLNAVIWLHNKGVIIPEGEMDWAVKYGCLPMIKWLYSIGIPLNDEHLAISIRRAEPRISEWIRSKGVELQNQLTSDDERGLE